ncbi:hypothetical protein DY000_02011309 [Brassica cretica]|uniref:Uncharacterized protein n=1 Tax=Brassica cretica TaxID=69181 RepID=A0ABQ7D2J6_BRACR|nr:hypothetical protein DY000_02011309 [Brassica cretica]
MNKKVPKAMMVMEGSAVACKCLGEVMGLSECLPLHRLGPVAPFLEARNVRCGDPFKLHHFGLVADDEQESPEGNDGHGRVCCGLQVLGGSDGIVRMKAMMVMEGSAVACKCLGEVMGLSEW